MPGTSRWHTLRSPGPGTPADRPPQASAPSTLGPPLPGPRRLPRSASHQPERATAPGPSHAPRFRPSPAVPSEEGPRACCTRAPRPQPTPARQAAAGHWARADGAQAAGARAGLTQPPEGRGVTGRGLTLAGRRWRLLRARARLAEAPRRLPEGDRGAGRGGAGGSLPSSRHVSAAQGASEDAGRGGWRLRRAARLRRRRAASRERRGAPPRRRRRPRGGGESCAAPPARDSCREVARAGAVGLARAGRREVATPLAPGASRLAPRARRP